jgi:hypothetical protein
MFKRTLYNVFYKRCTPCNAGENERRLKLIAKKQSETPDGHFLCSTCNNITPNDFQFIKPDGSNSKRCIDCKLRKDQQTLRNSLNVKRMIMERVLETGFSCAVLKEIHLKPFGDNPYLIRRFKVTDGLVTYNGVTYDHMDFVKLNKDELELSHLECDHIPEGEWKTLFPDKQWEPKVRAVGGLRSIETQQCEFDKCQVVSKLGHVRVTRDRYSGERSHASAFAKSKQAWTDNYKRSRNCVCVLCKVSYINEPLNFMHLDHLDVNAKDKDMSEMIRDLNVTLEMMIAEASECRLVCANCHKFVTDAQHKDGSLELKRLATLKRKQEDAFKSQNDSTEIKSSQN